MLIRRASAVFGKLNGQTLTLNDGLNILQAPNETGKSTWCAFLLSMLYGVNTRERDRAGFISEKKRRAPWSGAAMSGRLDCEAGGRSFTLLRTTRRPSAPMAEFQAVLTGSADPVPDLDGVNCGETLLGVSREVYARSAFIRQSGLAVTQDAGLERRIAALITSGEEDVSYSEAADTLKKEINRRRHNKTGQLPALEARLSEIEAQLAAQADLAHQLEALQARRAALSARECALRAELADSDRRENQRKYAACRQAAAQIGQADQRAQALRRRAEEARIPELESVSRLRGAIVNLETTRKAAAKARDQRDEAMKALLQAEAEVNESPFTGLTPEQAERLPPDLPPRPRFPLWGALLSLLPGAALAGALYSAGQGLPPSVGCGCGLMGLALLCLSLLTVQKQKRWEDQAARQRAGRDQALSLYAAQFQAVQAAREESAARSAAYDGLYATLTSNEQGILLEVRRFAPAAFDIPAADAALRACAVAWKEIAEADAAARDARLRLELLVQQLPEGADWQTAPLQPAEPALSSPERDRSSAELRQVQSELNAVLSEAGRLSGRLQAGGDPAALQAEAGQLREQISQLEGEYAALQLAAAALERANADLQTRFSPALGRRAAEIFAQLTGGAYSAVTLDRALHVSAQPAGSAIPRESALLSAGTADQLYLAVRLAVCELALPLDPEHIPPIVLDDALASFDGQRCAAALRFLRKEAERRQILLFTCHSREADFFRDDPAVSIQRLDRLEMEEPV